MDSAAACAALFLNIYYLEAWPIPWPLAASPLKLLLFSTLTGVAVAAAFYLRRFGHRSGRRPPSGRLAGWTIANSTGRF